MRGSWVILRSHADWYADENMKLTDCYYEKKDWRLCKKEVSSESNMLTPTRGLVAPMPVGERVAL